MEDYLPQENSLKHNKGVQLLAVFALTFLVLAVPFAVYLTQQETRTTPRAGQGPITDPDPDQYGATLSLIEVGGETVSVGQTFDVDVYINSGEYEITAAEIVVDYDTTLLETVSVEITDFLPQVLVEPEIKTTGNQKIVTFTIGSQPENPKTGYGTIATLHMRAKNNLGFASLLYNEDTQIAGIGSNSSILESAAGGGVNIVEKVVYDITTYFAMQALDQDTSPGSVPVKVELVDTDNPTNIIAKTVQAVRASDKLFDIAIENVPLGTYDVFVKGPAHLRKFLGTTQQQSWNPMYLPGSSLALVLAGDTVDNNVIDIFDYAKVVEDFGPRMPQSGSTADLDLDEDVDIFDYSLVVENFNSQGD